MSASDVNALELVDVGRRFGALAAVSNVDLTVAAGERRALLGANGAGKSTLFNLIAGDFPASDGSISLLGRDLSGVPARERTRMGLRRTYQNSSLFEQLTVADNLFIALRGVRPGRFSLRRPRRGGDELQRVAALADRVGMGRWLDHRVADLSHGQQRQLELGMALVGEPRVLLLDEPAAGLSPAERTHLLGLILGLPSSLTVVLIEHDLDIALRTADRVTVMHNGRLLVEGTPGEIRANQQVRDIYLGSQGN
ncbi:Lipopolysaccharide export system ATP-binding protein LptB [wastewater metagenome]|uniref:Lipopolysaccharide export system ATP-binding protein LptB n=2 Tax=unclassified sequences TaxID=12908 RepID=A0A5B8RJV5_9ZZZZ|nr:ABC transporter ATP-binding protein [Arhodomonas sp. KWT]QEA07395.1 lipopolysaccharide export system ATP-binding protein LptB [uncultured organism]